MICRREVVAESRLNHDARLAERDLLDLKRHQRRFLTRHRGVLTLPGNGLVQVKAMLTIMIISLLPEQDACAIRQCHPTQKDGKQWVLLRNIGSLRKQIPEHGSGQTNQIKGRIRLDLGILGILERITILLTIGFLVLRKLVAHERTSLPHRRQTDLKHGPLEINNLHEASLGWNTLQNAAQILVHKLTGGGDPHNIVSVEIVVGERQSTLRPCQRKHDLRNERRMMSGVFIFL